ncbi:T9SS type A sorting domain-containing protein [Marinilabilia sp.]|uniref:T9SS type A sorting domain-containing protein n=1 Tax=Marinilabilia sp. TaxID=2021252 RepID=UPI0025BA81D9|nr:T9SS type A sorting domain-containing protein [Marinilabilia sp.]
MKPTHFFAALLLFCSTATPAQTNVSPKEISAGTHQCTHDSGNDEWFSYSPDAPTWVILTSVDKTEADTYVEVYYEGYKDPFLRSDDYKNAQSRIRFVAEPDSTYIIKWRGLYAETGYKWDCIEENLSPGEHHSTAIEVTNEKMEFQIFPGYDVWYKYVSDGNQWVEMESSSYDYEVYQTRVDESHLIQSRYAPFRSAFSFSPQKGEVYYFHWLNTDNSFVDLSWKLINKTPQDGKTWDNTDLLPIEQVTRFNPQTGIDHWYRFIADSAGVLKINLMDDSDIILEAWEKETGTDVHVYFEEPNWENEYFHFNYKKDIEYIIRFRHQTEFYFNTQTEKTNIGKDRLNPKEIQEGVHFATTQYNTGEWFRYTPDATVDVQITTQYDAFAETTIHLFDEKSGILLASDTTENSKGKEGTIFFKAEESVPYLIYIGNSGHSSIEGIYWDLKKNPQFCSAPQFISPETSKTLLGNTDYWFEYTSRERSLVSVKATGLETEKQYVDIEFYLSCDSMIVAEEDYAKIYLNAGEKILIKTKGHHIENLYDVSIKETAQPIGAKEFPLEITAGNHQIQTNTDHWFIYHPKSTGKIVIDMPNDLSPMPELEIYRPHNNSKFVTTRSQDFGKAATRCKPGEPLYIHWFNNQSDVSFEWTLTEKEPVPGDVIHNALEAVQGINEMAKTNRMPTYYYYVPQSLGNIKISTCDLTDEDTFIAVYDSINQTSTTIFNGDACELQSEIEFACNPEDTIFFVWYEDYSNNPYSFSFTETPSLEGSERRNAQQATEGLNQVTFAETNIQFLKYTASIEGRIILSNCGTETSFSPDIQVFENESRWDEDTTSQICGENQKSIQFDIQPDNTYYIKFISDTTGTDINMEWNLEEALFEEGTHCTNPTTIDEGLHTSNSNKALWFRYTAKNNAEITLSRCNIEDNIDLYLQPRIYFNCTQELKLIERTWCGDNKKHTFQAIKDSTYFITWGYISDDQIQWELSESTYAPNGYCQDAKEVKMGMNLAEHSGNGDIWYRFTPLHDGNITLNSAGLTDQDTEVELHSGCSNGLSFTEIFSNDRYNGEEQARLSEECVANETYYIRWRGDKITAPYEWEFIYVAKGDVKEDPLEASLGENVRTVTDSTSQFFAYQDYSESQFLEITIPHEEGKIRKLNVFHEYESSKEGISFNEDSTEAEIQHPYYGGNFVIECINEPGDSFTWTIENRFIDTLAVNTQLLGHTDFINDWFVLSGEEKAFYTIESDKPQKAYADLELFSRYPSSERKMSPMVSDLEIPVYQLSEKPEHYIKWAMPEKGKTDYWWSLAQFYLSGSGECINAQPAKPGDIHSNFVDYNLMYKMRLDKSGRYIISAKSGDLQRLKIESLRLYRGNCNTLVWMGAIDFTDAMPGETLMTSITLDSIAKNTSYYLEWDFGRYGNQIKKFSWNLKLDAEYDVGLQNPEQEYFFISKNPNNGRFQITCPELSEETILEVYNISGNRVYSARLQAHANKHTVDISGNPSGIYLVSLRNSVHSYTQKILIQKRIK